ncbi:MAG TPA: amino acid permease [Candidatus Babeliales bacterium]|nr:amino acid permease [Candidatus Babeliales bacterium]
MAQTQKLSLLDAILININVMFGTGVLINTVNLAVIAGFLGFASYITVALLMLPLIFSIAATLNRHPSGGFYAYAATDIHPAVGFLSAWSYFVGKLASAALLIHIFTSTMKVIIPALDSIPSLPIDFAILGLFTWLNMFNIKTGTRITYGFIFCKFTPIIFAILSCLALFSKWHIPVDSMLWAGIPSTIPLVLYAFVGFEVACSISNSIEDAEKNGPKSILYSFGIVVFLTVLYQLLMFATIGEGLTQLPNFLGIFKVVLNEIIPSAGAFKAVLLKLFYIAGASSALGGSYGILFSNSWNLYTLAQFKHIPFAKFFTSLNNYQVPFMCVLAESAICAGYLLLTAGHQVTLQQISVLGCTIAYACSVLGLIKAHRHESLSSNPFVAWAAIGSCLLLLGSCIRNFISSGIIYLGFFGILIALGMILYAATALSGSANLKRH